MTDKVKVLCSRCKNPFREKVSNMREGYQTQCPNCYRLIIFDPTSQDPGVRRAMTEARRIRNGIILPKPESSEAR
jgi:hypothetical protein